MSQLFASGGQSIGVSASTGLISFRMDWLDLLAVQGTLKSLLPHHSSKALILLCSVQFSSVAQSCLTLCDPMDCSMPGLPSITDSWSLLTLMSIKSMMPSNYLILCCPLLFLPSIFPSIRVFSNESALFIRWPKYWSFSFNLSSSNEHPGLISFRMDWLDLLAV